MTQTITYTKYRCAVICTIISVTLANIMLKESIRQLPYIVNFCTDHLCDIISWSRYNLSTPLYQFLTFSLDSQREREAFKDEWSYYGVVDKSLSEQQICGSASISFVVRKYWTYPPTASGCYSR